MIFYYGSITALHMPDWKFSEGGRWVKFNCKMGRCMKKVENHWSIRKTWCNILGDRPRCDWWKTVSRSTPSLGYKGC